MQNKRFVLEFANGEKWYFYTLNHLVEECFKQSLKKRKVILNIEEIHTHIVDVIEGSKRSIK